MYTSSLQQCLSRITLLMLYSCWKWFPYFYHFTTSHYLSPIAPPHNLIFFFKQRKLHLKASWNYNTQHAHKSQEMQNLEFSKDINSESWLWDSISEGSVELLSFWWCALKPSLSASSLPAASIFYRYQLASGLAVSKECYPCSRLRITSESSGLQT